MHVSHNPHPFIVFVDEDRKRLDQVDLWEVDASFYQTMVTAADNVQLYVNGALKMFSVESITFSPATGYTFVMVKPVPDDAEIETHDNSTEMEGQMCIDDFWHGVEPVIESF